MEVAPSPLAASAMAVARSPESLRRRQRDRLSPRRGFANSSRPVAAAAAVATTQEMGGSPETKVALAPAPRSKGVVHRLDSARKKKPLQDGLRKENSLKRRAKREEEAKYDVHADGGPVGREGRHFTVSNVGNNGRIYLR